MFRLVPKVHRVIRQCHQCQVKDQKAPKQKDVYHHSVQAGAPFQVWSMDILGPLRASSEGHRYLLTLKDVFSKWFEAIPLSNTTSDKVLHALQLLYARFGHPLQGHTKNATYFGSQLMREDFKLVGIKLTFTPTYNPQSNSVERVHRDLNAMLRVLCHQHAADWEEVLPAALLALRSVVHESTGVTPFACAYGKEPATPPDILCCFPGAPMAASNYVRQLQDHQFKAHRFVQTQLARAIQRSSRRYGNERDAIQVGEKVWLFTSKPSADSKLAIPYTGPWRVTHQPSGTLQTIHPEGSWCQHPKSITVSLNRLKRCHGEDGAPQRVDFNLRELEAADDDAEGPMTNSWVTTENAAATQALNQDAGDVHAPGLQGDGITRQPPETLRASQSAAYSSSIDDVTPSILIHHEHTNAVSPPDQSSNTQSPPFLTDSSTMTTSATPVSTAVRLATTSPAAAPNSQEWFDQSVQARPCSSFTVDETLLPAFRRYRRMTSSNPTSRPGVSPSQPPPTAQRRQLLRPPTRHLRIRRLQPTTHRGRNILLPPWIPPTRVNTAPVYPGLPTTRSILSGPTFRQTRRMNLIHHLAHDDPHPLTLTALGNTVLHRPIVRDIPRGDFESVSSPSWGQTRLSQC